VQGSQRLHDRSPVVISARMADRASTKAVRESNHIDPGCTEGANMSAGEGHIAVVGVMPVAPTHPGLEAQ
jgi:hypothetical protein